MKNLHEFAIYIDNLSALITSIAPGGQLILDNKDIYHRIMRVLRLRPEEHCVLFDRTIHGTFLIKEFKAKQIVVGILLDKQINTILSPHITFMLPILKRDGLDTAIYSLVEVGVNKIQLITTEKAQRAWRGEKEYARLHRVMIAAAEQSKNFAFSELLPPITFNVMCNNLAQEVEPIIFFDPQGIQLSTLLSQFKAQKPKALSLIVGPEGDLTTAEKELLKKSNTVFCTLTPTILRACQAAGLSAGIFRSLT